MSSREGRQHRRRRRVPAVGILGLFLIGTDANILSLNGADNVLHLASAIVLLGVGLSQDKNVRADVPVA